MCLSYLKALTRSVVTTYVTAYATVRIVVMKAEVEVSNKVR